MIAVSNTTPLRYLIAIEHGDFLGRLFEKVLVPAAVHEELTDERTPADVRDFILAGPAWYEIRAVQEASSAAFPVTLHRGEREAIALAETLRPDVVLIDELTGRMIAFGRMLPVSGTLGVLERGDKMGLIVNFPDVLDRLKNSGFFIADSLYQQLLQRHYARSKAK